MASPIYFAIGDIHGEASKLAALHDAIFDRIAFEKSPARIVHLGDYVDRGPDSRSAVETVMALEARHPKGSDIEIVSLMGNHEQMMLNAVTTDDLAESWWSQGGAETADSYAGGPGRASKDWRDTIPKDHLFWLIRRPTLRVDKERRLAFVHAGIDPANFPECDDRIRLWTRSPKFMEDKNWPDRPELEGLLVIHGHTPTPDFQPEVTRRRINVDTGACFGGPLTAVMLKEGVGPEFLRVE